MFIASIDFRDGVNDLNVSANKSVSSSFVCRMTHEHMTMLLNVDKNECIFALLGRQFTQMNAYFIVMNSKTCKIRNSVVMVRKRVPGCCRQVTKGIYTIRSGQWFRQTERIMSS